MARTRIKICGVRNLDTALACVEAGADAIGLNFVDSSPRYVAPSEAWRIVSSLPPFITTVGVFANQSLERYIAIEETCPTDYGQLHGNEPKQVVRQCGPRIIKAVRFDPVTIEQDLKRWSEVDEVDAIMVDAGRGGEGESFNWSALAKVKRACTKPLLLAGGLKPENVAEAIRVVQPYAVDVASGVEKERGVKDVALIQAFCANVTRA
jgi:phosphoribosylanthranilate isomerase